MCIKWIAFLLVAFAPLALRKLKTNKGEEMTSKAGTEYKNTDRAKIGITMAHIKKKFN